MVPFSKYLLLQALKLNNYRYFYISIALVNTSKLINTFCKNLSLSKLMSNRQKELKFQ